MSNEALSMAKLLIGCVTRGDVNGQRHWALKIAADAIQRGAVDLTERQLDTEDAIEEARR